MLGMCDILTTADGIELTTPDELRRYGIDVPTWAGAEPGDDHRCLCSIDIAGVLAGHPAAWRWGFSLSGDGWEEVGPDGRTWWEGFDVRTKDPRYTRGVRLARSDGRSKMTLEAWEAAQAVGTDSGR